MLARWTGVAEPCAAESGSLRSRLALGARAPFVGRAPRFFRFSEERKGMLVRRSTSWLLLGTALLAGSGAPGCGYSEDEMQAKIREIEGLKTQLSAEQAQNKKAKAE